jgi:phosphatidate cytidylyltransferase
MTAALLVATFSGAYLHSSLLFSLLLCATFLVVLWYEWPRLVPVSGFAGVLFSLLYPCLPMIGLLALHHLYYPQDFYLSLYPFLIAWTADTWGYIVGKLFGWHKICPSISPGKSWEGLAGSFVGVIGANFLILPSLEAPFAVAVRANITWTVALSVLLTVIAFLGGFMLSVFKRAKNLKDAGNVLPGHGGFLDRLDSVFAVVLVVWGLLLAPVIARQSAVLYASSKPVVGLFVTQSKNMLVACQKEINKLIKATKK